jgi:hypothetical protein
MSFTYRRGFMPFPIVPVASVDNPTYAPSGINYQPNDGFALSTLCRLFWLSKSVNVAINFSYSLNMAYTDTGGMPHTVVDTGTAVLAATDFNTNPVIPARMVAAPGGFPPTSNTVSPVAPVSMGPAGFEASVSGAYLIDGGSGGGGPYSSSTGEFSFLQPYSATALHVPLAYVAKNSGPNSWRVYSFTRFLIGYVAATGTPYGGDPNGFLLAYVCDPTIGSYGEGGMSSSVAGTIQTPWQTVGLDLTSGQVQGGTGTASGTVALNYNNFWTP